MGHPVVRWEIGAKDGKKLQDSYSNLGKVESLGGKTLVPPTPIPNVGSFALFTDPEGHCIGLFKG